MKKPEINFIINAFMFLCMSAIAGIGFLIKYTLISGQERWIVYNDNVELYFWGLDRHEWGTIHLIIGFVLLGLLVLHIVLHWALVVSVYHKMFQRKLMIKLISIVFITICALFIGLPFFINPEVSKVEHGGRRHLINSNIPIKSKCNISREKYELNKSTIIDEHEQSSLEIEIRGYMTLDEISKKYEVPIEFIKTRLNIPESVSGVQKMGWLRKRYSIKMHDVEEVIKEHQEVK